MKTFKSIDEVSDEIKRELKTKTQSYKIGNSDFVLKRSIAQILLDEFIPTSRVQTVNGVHYLAVSNPDGVLIKYPTGEKRFVKGKIWEVILNT